MSAWAIEEVPMAEQETLTLRVDRFFAPFEPAFRRRDQVRWAKVYLQGLVDSPGRKTVENLARAVAIPEGLRVEDAAQALGHFVNQSPWDEGALWGRYQAWIAQRATGGAFILEELPFEKQGRHSVGVQRQLSRALGRKTNCQIGVMLYHSGPGGCYPLAMRLYLPRGWVAEDGRLGAAGVPEPARQAKTKLDIGLELIDAARQAGILATELIAGLGWPESEDFTEAARERGLATSASPPEAVAACRDRMIDRLGLGHFEGRSWRGFHHHACLVTLAAAMPGEATSRSA
jgi:SRSO17 transposase